MSQQPPVAGEGRTHHADDETLAYIAELERRLSDVTSERDEARGAAVKGNRDRERLHGLLREMKSAMLGHPMSMRGMTPTALLHAINAELREPETAK